MEGPVVRPVEDVENLYSHTIRLCQENKINAKNTWSLNLIDHIGALVQEQKQDAQHGPATGPATGPSTNFGLAGCTLDAGVKIYSHRVDFIHTNALKIRGGLGKTVNPEDAEGPAEDAPRRRTRRTGAGATLDKKENITQPDGVDQEGMVDPLFHKMSADFDEGGARGMLLNGLSVGPHCEILFDSAEIPDQLGERLDDTPNESGSFDLASVITEFQAVFSSTAEPFCPSVASYVKQQSAQVLDASSTFPQSSGTLNHTEAPIDGQEDDSLPSFDYTGCDFEESAGPLGAASLIHEISTTDFPDHEDEDDPDVRSEQPNGFVSKSMDLVEAGVELSANDYEMLDARAMVNWTGMAHWKHRMVNHRKANLSTKRPRGKTAMLLDFYSDPPEVGFRSAFTEAKQGAIELSTASKSKLSAAANLLPNDVHYETKQLTCLMTKPDFYISETGATTPEVEREQNGLEIGDDDPIGLGYDDVDEQYDDQQISAPAGDWGIDSSQPDQSGQQGINFARKAKTVNVRQLKESLWSDLSENAARPSKESQGPEETPQNSTHLGSLQGLVSNLPNKLPKEALVEVSVSFVFICVLHLANENGLVVAGTTGLDDLKVDLPTAREGND